MTVLDRKLAAHDTFVDAAFSYLVGWLDSDREALKQLARGRLVEGHYRFGDRLMYEYDTETLKAEAAEEVADCLNYITRRLALVDGDRPV